MDLRDFASKMTMVPLKTLVELTAIQNDDDMMKTQYVDDIYEEDEANMMTEPEEDVGNFNFHERLLTSPDPQTSVLFD
jgi:hypothetical protein